MAHVFISHATEDQAAVAELAARLRRCSVSVFQSGDSISPGENWQNEIIQQLQIAESVWIYGTTASLKNTNVNFEVGQACGAGKRVIPLLIDVKPEAMPSMWKCRQAVQLVGLTKEEADKRIDLLIGQECRIRTRIMMVLAALGAWLLAVLFSSDDKEPEKQ